jgi:hypothetical protein
LLAIETPATQGGCGSGAAAPFRQIAVLELQSWGESRDGGLLSRYDAAGDVMADRASALPNPNEKLVKVFDSEQESEALVVKGLLDSAGIDSDMTSVDAVQDMFPGVGGTVILVREEDADAARRLIDEYRQSPDADETQEIDISEDSPTAG